MTYRILLVILLSSFCWPPLTLAGILHDSNGIKINQTNPGGQCLRVLEVEPGVYDIEINNITADWTTIIYTISATASNVKIRNIWIEPCEVPSSPSTIVQVNVDEDGGTFTYIQNIRKRSCVSSSGCDDLDGNTGTINVSVNSITGHIGHPSLGGMIECDKVDWLRSLAGNIYADVFAQSRIDWVLLPNGTSSVFGDLVSLAGRVWRVQAAGSVGTILDPVTISGVGDTDIISAANGGVHAHINIGGTVRNMRSYASDWTGSFEAVRADDFNNPGGLGLGYKITGVTARLMAGLRIEEDWSTFLGAEQIGEDVVVRIGEDLNNSAFDPTEKAFQLRALDGLAGQIIVNAEMTGGDWNGSVRVNTSLNAGQPLIDLSPTSATADEVAPHYKVLSHRLGGGAVGLAPFNFHQFTGPAPATRSELDCNPHHAEYLAVGPCGDVAALNQVVIDHYGPVLVEGEGPHYRVEFRAASAQPAAHEVSGLLEDRRARLLRARLVQGDQVNASDLAAWIDSPFEVNMDGQVCSEDFADMSAAYDNQ